MDLAGSERLTEFDTSAIGETGHINKSLFVLAKVVNKLAEGKEVHIPYRDSKLTRILQLALGGNSLAVIICTISPALMNFQQTLGTLRFANRAKVVKNKPMVNKQQSRIQAYKHEIIRLKEEMMIKDHLIARFQDPVSLNILNKQPLAPTIEISSIESMPYGYIIYIYIYIVG